VHKTCYRSSAPPGNLRIFRCVWRQCDSRDSDHSWVILSPFHRFEENLKVYVRQPIVSDFFPGSHRPCPKSISGTQSLEGNGFLANVRQSVWQFFAIYLSIRDRTEHKASVQHAYNIYILDTNWSAESMGNKILHSIALFQTITQTTLFFDRGPPVKTCLLLLQIATLWVQKVVLARSATWVYQRCCAREWKDDVYVDIPKSPR
jgi:hypothetical protein